MCQRMITILFLVCAFCIGGSAYGQKVNYQQFENIYLGAEASVISCFLQDSEGLIWIGSNKGLFSYDGYSTQQHFTYGERNNTRIYCGIIADNTYLYLGTDNGILVYNYRTDKYEQPETDFPTDVRTMALQGDTLWIGSLNGLYTYQLNTKKLASLDSKSNGLPHHTIYSIIRTTDNQIYVGTYNGLCRYIEESGKFENIPLPVNRSVSNLFVNSLLEDTSRQCIWIGMEGSLFQYTPATGLMKPIDAFHNNSIKSLALDGDGNLLAGTDNGLYVYQNDNGTLQHIVHDSRNIQSLTNNIIWNIFADQEQNIWLGTDYGISLSRYNSALQFIPISQITGTGDGNQFYSLFRDSKGFYWFGGTNGVIRFTNPTGNKHDAVWYRMGDKHHPLSHNRIRHIYEDREQQLWIATDGSINRYDYKTHQFVHYNIVDSTGTNNTNWAYYLFEDTDGKLWIATCLGGIFVVDKQMDKEWNFLKSNTNRITYSNLNYGDYQLIISKVEKSGHPSEHPYILNIKILPPWYYTVWAKVIYVLLFLSLIIWTINFFRVKNRLKMERMEKEKILEQSRQKMAFFSNLSNELKTPLSRIIAPVSQLLPATEEAHEKQTLEEVQRNAMKINSLIHQVLNFNRIEDNEDSLLILSRIELVSFSHSLFSVYEEDKRLTFLFETNKAKIYADMDAIKLGVILDSLLSNAVKFTPDGGSIRLSLFYREETGLVDICVSDTGSGIPPRDIPYIFQRFFQSPHSGNKEGTGIGLYLVKTYTELHGGHITGVTSEEGKGTSVGLNIPVIAVEEEEIPATQEKKRLESLPVLKPIEAESQDEKFLSNIIRLIEDHLSESELNVNALCELSGISNKQIYRKIKQLTGMSPVEYIKSIRMKKAAMLLQQKKFTVAEVMYMVGFSNHSYFSKCFQAEFGKTPKQYMQPAVDEENHNK